MLPRSLMKSKSKSRISVHGTWDEVRTVGVWVLNWFVEKQLLSTHGPVLHDIQMLNLQILSYVAWDNRLWKQDLNLGNSWSKYRYLGGKTTISLMLNLSFSFRLQLFVRVEERGWDPISTICSWDPNIINPVKFYFLRSFCNSSWCSRWCDPEPTNTVCWIIFSSWLQEILLI